MFHIYVEDVDQETILPSELFILKGRYMEEEHVVSLTVPIMKTCGNIESLITHWR